MKKHLILRAEIIKAVREFFVCRGYLEVETPVRIPAPAPEAHIDAVESEGAFLHTSPEICMKRLLCAGYLRIFQICKCFRQGERGKRHLPEFTILEWYCAEMDYLDMMTECEDMIRFAAEKTGFGNKLNYQGKTVDITSNWDRMTVSSAFEKFGSMPMEDAISANLFDEIIAFEIEPNLGWTKPVFLYEYPACCAAFARLKAENPMVAERFELYICGTELCNAFGELTDPKAQLTRFETEQGVRRQRMKPIYPMPEKFLDSLSFMPESSGNALGIDRLVMLFADAQNIDAVVAFTPEEL